MRMTKQAVGRTLRSAGLAGLGLGALLLCTSQLHCALSEAGWLKDSGTADTDGGYPDGGNPDGDNGVRCFTGTATTELQLLNHCTEAEHVERVSNIPAATWDGKMPLPYSK
jgi:hypothetical protein